MRIKQNKSQNSKTKIAVEVTMKSEEGEGKRNTGRRNLKKKRRNTYLLDFGVTGKIWPVAGEV